MASLGQNEYLQKGKTCGISSRAISTAIEFRVSDLRKLLPL